MKETLNRSVTKIQTLTLCLIIMFGCGIGLFGQRVQPQQALYLDPQQPVENRVKDLMSRLTVVEKATLLDRTLSLPRLNIGANLGWT